jgi:hypothetical protein
MNFFFGKKKVKATLSTDNLKVLNQQSMRISDINRFVCDTQLIFNHFYNFTSLVLIDVGKYLKLSRGYVEKTLNLNTTIFLTRFRYSKMNKV